MIASLSKAANNLLDVLNTELPSSSFKYRIQIGDSISSIVTKQFNSNNTLTDFQRDKVVSIILNDPRNHLKDEVNLPVGHVLYIPKRMQV